MNTLIPINYWYAALPNEIFLDLDSKRALSRAFNVLSLALKRGDLKIRNIYLYRSMTKDHVHVIVQLKEFKLLPERIAWSLWMANDRLRAAFVLKRWVDDQLRSAVDLLVSKKRYYRAPDDMCHCEGKHKNAKVTSKCDAMIRLLGSAERASADYFTRTGRVGFPPVDPIVFPWGKISKMKLRQWGESNGQRKNVL